jgi:long-chain fatty acid transport protein
MAGTSIARPQDLLSAINANPSTLRQYRGTQFTFSGAWADADYRINQSAPLPLIGVQPFNATSSQLGALLGNIGVTQGLDELGLPVTLGAGFITNSGLGVDFRGVPASNDTASQIIVLQMVAGAGVSLTDDLSLGATFQLGTGYLDGPFSGIGAMTTAYGARGTIGANYAITPNTSIGAYWQTHQQFNFENAAQLPIGPARDVHLDLPTTYGIGIANSSLFDGKLLLAVDFLFKEWSDANLFGHVYTDQWAVQTGLQYALTPTTRVRLGYAYNENPMRGPAITAVAGIPLPDGVPALRYIQGQFASITQHRVTLGLGVSDLLISGLDFDLFAGYAFSESDTFATTAVSISDNYWVGAGFTWRFGAAR